MRLSGSVRGQTPEQVGGQRKDRAATAPRPRLTSSATEDRQVDQMMIEEDTGTYTATGSMTRTHNGYCAGDFKDVPFTWTKLYPPFVTMPTYPRR